MAKACTALIEQGAPPPQQRLLARLGMLLPSGLEGRWRMAQPAKTQAGTLNIIPELPLPVDWRNSGWNTVVVVDISS